MSITVISRGAVAEQDVQREVHHPSARKILKEEYKQREDVLAGKVAPALMGGGTYKPLDSVQDIPALRSAMVSYKKNYERGAPVTLTPATRNYLWKKAKRLKDEIVIGMVSKRDMHPVKHREIVVNGKAKVAAVVDNERIKSSKAIERNNAWMAKNQKKVDEFKRIMRHLEPDNPKIANIERFRPK